MSTNLGFKSINGLTATDADLDAFASRKGVPTLQAKPVPTTAPAVTLMPQPKAVQTPRRVTLDLPEYVVDQLHDKARAGRCTTRHVIMTALQATGVDINEDDMVSDGRRLR